MKGSIPTCPSFGHKYTIEYKKLKIELHDKRDSFNFSVVNYPFVRESNIPAGPTYGVYSSRLISTARPCDTFESLKKIHDSLCIKLIKQGFQYNRLCKQLNKSLHKHKELFSSAAFFVVAEL